MTIPYRFKPEEIEQIVHRFGKPFYEKMMSDLERYATRWALTSFQLIPSYSANLVFRCHAEQYGGAVLKIGESSEMIHEYNTLLRYAGRRFCKVYEADIGCGILLEESIQPGTALRQECSLEQRLAVFCSLYNDLHLPAAQADLFPTYTGWVDKITEYMSQRPDCRELFWHMRKAREICLSVSALYSQRKLLHGDLHHDNMLLGRDGTYRIIDPKGVIGDPLFDVPRFVLNEFSDPVTPELYKKINDILSVLGQQLSIPKRILQQCLYVETAMGACWFVEDGADPEEYSKLLQDVAFAEAVMNG